MASITQVNGKWRALVRRKGHKAQCKTFAAKAAAEAWARKVEAEIDAGKSPAARSAVTVAEVIQAYRDLREHGRPILDTSTEHYTLKKPSGTASEVMSTRSWKCFQLSSARCSGE